MSSSGLEKSGVASEAPFWGHLAGYVEKILWARVYDVAVETPLEPARGLSSRLGNHVLLKREDRQSVFSFKCRGAYDAIYQRKRRGLATGVVAASAGNHGQGVALAATQMGLRSVVVMPVTTPSIKVQAVHSLGANVNFDRLRHVGERAEIGESCQALFAIGPEERPGSFLDDLGRPFHRETGNPAYGAFLQ